MLRRKNKSFYRGRIRTRDLDYVNGTINHSGMQFSSLFDAL